MAAAGIRYGRGTRGPVSPALQAELPLLQPSRDLHQRGLCMELQRSNKPDGQGRSIFGFSEPLPRATASGVLHGTTEAGRWRILFVRARLSGRREDQHLGGKIKYVFLFISQPSSGCLSTS